MLTTYRDRIAIFCIGNYYVSDDGFAIHLYNALRRARLPSHVDLLKVGSLGMAQIDLIRPYRKLLVVDAVRGMGRPGRIVHGDPLSPRATSSKTQLSVHDFGISELLALVATLYPENLPQQIVLHGVEAEVLDRYGTNLSPCVRHALEKVLDNIIREVK